MRSSNSVVIGYASGVFDMFHVGHLNVLRAARAHCDYLIAGVVSDELTRTYKGKSPVVPLAERLEIVGSVRGVDRAVAETLPSKLLMWEQLRFHVMIKGDDWRDTPRGLCLEADLASVGAELIYVPYTLHTSSTLRRGELAAREFALGA